MARGCYKYVCRVLLVSACLLILIGFYIFPSNQRRVKQLEKSSAANTKKVIKAARNQIYGRLAVVKKNCKRLGYTTNLQFNKLNFRNLSYPWIYVSHKYKFLYCQTPKVGTTNWMKVIATLENNKHGGIGDNSDVHMAGLLRLSSLHETERVRVMKDYKKFMVIREPFERAVSAYKDKFVPHAGSNRSVLQTTAEQIVKYYRNHNEPLTDNNEVSDNIPSFLEFIQYVVDKNSKVSPLFYWESRHWMPLTDLCYPCNINYDFILNIGNIAEESEFLLRSLGVSQNIHYPSWTDSSTKERTGSLQKWNERTVQYFNNIDKKYIHYIYLLYKYYKKDYEIFGFETLPQLQPLIQGT